MTTASNPWEWATRPSHEVTTGQALGRWHAYRMSQSFAGVGVNIRPARLRQIAAGAAVGSDELTDVNFALTAIEIMREERRAKFDSGRRLCTRCLLFIGLVLVVLNFLICMTYLVLSAIEHASGG